MEARMKRQFLFYCAAATSIAWGQVDARTIVRTSIANCERDWRASLSWAWTQTDVSALDGNKEAKVSEMVPLNGTHWQRLIMRDGRPLDPEEQRRENRKFARAQKQRESESPSQREARIRKYEAERAFIRDIPDAYNFTVLGQEIVDGGPAWKIGIAPRPGFVATTPNAAMLKHFDGTLWIDKEDLQWVRVEAEAKDIVSIGWFVARISPGARFTFEQARVANGLWMPKRLTVKGLVRLMMVYGKHVDQDITWSGYHPEKQLEAATR
jgi:hypothetical protein